MALSNIFREPRREITETAVGFGLFAGFAFLDCLGAVMLAKVADGTIWVSRKEFFACLLGSTILLIVLAVLVICLHVIGEAVCDKLERGGVRLRPIDRRTADSARNHRKGDC